MEAPQIYVPPDSRGEDPFVRERRKQLRRRLAIGGGVAGVVLLGALGWLLLRGDGTTAFTPEPGPLATALRETDWRRPRDPQTGFRVIATALRPGNVIDGAAIGRDGTVAIAMHEPTQELWLIVWRQGRWRWTSAGAGPAITRVAVDPEGNVWAALDGSRLMVDRREGPAEVLIGAVSSGYSIDALAFDARSQKSAVMVAGGRIRTGMRPLQPSRLNEVRLPARVRPRVMAYDDDGQLVVGGDAGAVAVAGASGWDETTLPTNGRIAAFGHAANGDLLAAQSNGHVFRLSGSTWDRVGQLQAAPVAVGELPERGITVVTANGGIFATLGRDEFSELPGWVAPQGFAGAFTAQIAGANVLMVSRERLVIYDGAGDPFDSAAPEVATAGGSVGAEGCEPVGPASLGIRGLPHTLWRCNEAYTQLEAGGGFRTAPRIAVAGGEVGASDFTRELEATRTRAHAWLGGRLLSVAGSLSGPTLTALDPARGTMQPIASRPAGEGDLISIAAWPTADDGSAGDVWTLSRDGTLRHQAVAAGAPAGEPAVITIAADFHGVHPGGSDSTSVLVRALGPGRAVVHHRPGRILVRADATRPHVLEALRLPDPPGFIQVEEGLGGDLRVVPPTPDLLLAGGRVFASSGNQLIEIPPEGDPILWALPDGIELPRERGYGWGRPGMATAVGRDGTLHVLADTREARHLLACRNRRCTSRPISSLGGISDLVLSEDGRIVLALASGLVAIEEPR